MTRQFPKPLGDPVDHYWLVQSMARAAGVDLAAASNQGRLTDEAWAEVVNRCRDCDWERNGGCSRWLSRQEAGEATVPDNCVNQDVFADLLAENSEHRTTPVSTPAG